MKNKVLCFGSNASADIIRQNSNANDFEIVEHYTRSSFASMASEPIKQKPALQKLNSSQKRALRRDFSKEFMEAVAKKSYHILLVDFLDERFHLLQNKGYVVTRTVELVTSKSHLRGFSLVEANSNEYFLLWLKGWQTFVSKMTKLKLVNRIRLNKVFYVKPTNGSDDTIKEINLLNSFLSRLYVEAEKSLNLEQIYEYPKEYFVAEQNALQDNRMDYRKAHFDTGYSYLANDKGLAELVASIVTPKPKVKLPLSRKLLKYLSQDLPLTLLKLNAVKKLGLGDKKAIHSFVKNEIFSQAESKLTFDNRQIIEFLYNKPTTTHLNSKKLLVCFNAAVGQRDVKSGPFFSGVGLSEELQLPLLCIADPLVSHNANVGLAWYAGGEDSQALQKQLTELLEQIYHQYGYELIIFGGSGGGFASLVQATQLKIPATVVVWNPQTSILNYLKGPVETYVNTAFKQFRSKADFTLKQILDWFSIQHEVNVNQIKDQIKLVYLQNQTDSHTRVHAEPFMMAGRWSRLRNASFKSSLKNIFVYYGDWGRGHVAPPKALLSYLFRGEVNNQDFSILLHELDAGRVSGINTPQYFNISKFKGDGKFSVKYKEISTNELWVSILCESKTNIDYRYSFQLYNDGEILYSTEYSKEGEVYIPLPCAHNNLRVEVGVQDDLGNVVRIKSNLA